MPRVLKATALPALLMVLAVGSAKEPSVLPKARQVWADAKTNTLGAPSRDGRFLSFVDVDSGDLAVLELETGRKRRLTHNDPQRDAGQFAYFSAISPDSRHVAYAWFNEKKFYELLREEEYLDGGGNRNPYLDPELLPLKLTTGEKRALVAFLHSLTGTVREGMGTHR